MAIFTSSGLSTVHAQSVLNACMNNSDGTIKIVPAGTTCKRNETLISWPSVDDDTLGNLVCSAGQTLKFDGTGWVCDPPARFVDNGDGTITDNQTGLMWEKKLAADGSDGGNCDDAIQANRSRHCVNNTYAWSNNLNNPNGPLFADFLASINTELSTSFNGSTIDIAGYQDWRIPNIAELRTIVEAICPIAPCIDPIFGATDSALYWSSTTSAISPVNAWGVHFVGGGAGQAGKAGINRARAVRGGR